MSSINEAKRLVKRVILTNLLSENLYITPLLSGKHGIGKSAIMREVAHDINADLIVIEGGTLKEGEITGLPYQYQNNESVEFRFLPYYAVAEIKEKEQNLNLSHNITNSEKIELLKKGIVKPTIVFIDELNRTDNAVYRELMNIILTKNVNGYELPWWVFFTSAINPSSIDSIYATNEMDPAQLDRFIRISVTENINDFIDYSLKKDLDKSLISFLSNNVIYLSDSDVSLEDINATTPSPRGWEMVSNILKSKEVIKSYFSKEELKYEDYDIKTLIGCKVGQVAATAYINSLEEQNKLITAYDIFDYEYKGLSREIKTMLESQSTAMNSITNKLVVDYLVNNYEMDNVKNHQSLHDKVKSYMSLLDSPSKLVFAELLTNSLTKKDTSLYDEFYYLFDDNLLNMLYQNIDNERLLING